MTAQSYRVDGAGVQDAPAATAATRTALGDGGEHHAQAASTLNGTADALESAAGTSAGHLRAMNESLAGVAGAMDLLSAAAPSMLATDVATAQQRLFDQAVAAVRQHGSVIAEQASSYDDVLRRTGAVLAEHAPPPGDDSYGAPPAPPPPPPEPSLLDEAGDFLGDVADRIGAFGEAALHNPGAVAAGVLGAGLIAVSTAGGAASIGLDVTGVGALIGVPAGALSVAGIATGTAILGSAVASINADADSGSRSSTSDGQAPQSGATPSKVEIDPGKYDYIFGKVKSGPHNEERSIQNLEQMQRVGIQDNAEGRAILQEHLESVARAEGNILRTKETTYGSLEIKDSLLAGPHGFVHLESTWMVTNDGLRLVTVIPKGG